MTIRKAPERLDAVAVGRALHALVVAVVDTVMPIEAHIYLGIDEQELLASHRKTTQRLPPTEEAA